MFISLLSMLFCVMFSLSAQKNDPAISVCENDETTVRTDCPLMTKCLENYALTLFKIPFKITISYSLEGCSPLQKIVLTKDLVQVDRFIANHLEQGKPCIVALITGSAEVRSDVTLLEWLSCEVLEHFVDQEISLLETLHEQYKDLWDELSEERLITVSVHATMGNNELFKSKTEEKLSYAATVTNFLVNIDTMVNNIRPLIPDTIDNELSEHFAQLTMSNNRKEQIKMRLEALGWGEFLREAGDAVQQ